MSTAAVKKTNKTPFAYGEVSQELIKKYSDIYALKEAIPEKTTKRIFDFIGALFIFIMLSPLYVIVLLGYFIEALFNKDARGPVFSTYMSTSQGKEFKKLKFRLVKWSLVDKEKAEEFDYKAFPSEHEDKNLTVWGKFLRKFYLDELAQVLCVLRGDISFVGPRPLAKIHYEMALKNKQITRKLVKAGLFSYTHVSKNTETFVDPEPELKYARHYLNLPGWRLVLIDLGIMLKGAKMIFKGNGDVKAEKVLKK